MNLTYGDIFAARKIAATALFAAATLQEEAATNTQWNRMMRAPVLAQDAQPLKLRRVVAGMLAAGFGAHVAREPATQTTYVAAIPTGGARNSRSPLSMEQQREVYEAAEAKRARKQQAHVILAGGSVAEEF